MRREIATEREKMDSPPSDRRSIGRDITQLQNELNEKNWAASAATLRDILKSRKCIGYVFSTEEGAAILVAFVVLFTHFELGKAFDWYRTCWPSLEALLLSSTDQWRIDWFNSFLSWSERLMKTEEGLDKTLALYDQFLPWIRTQNLPELEIKLLFAKGDCYLRKHQFNKAAVHYELARTLGKGEWVWTYFQKCEQLLADLIYEKTLKEVDFDKKKFGEVIWFDHHVQWLYRQGQRQSLSNLLHLLVWMGDTLYRSNALKEAENCYKTLRALANHETPCLELIEEELSEWQEEFNKMTTNLFVQRQINEKLSCLKSGEPFEWCKETNSLAFLFPWWGDKKSVLAMREKATQALDVFLQQGSNASAYQVAWQDYLITRENCLQELFINIITTLGEPACLYNLLLLGSSGRREACPYSDVEYAVGFSPHPKFPRINIDTSCQYLDLACHLFNLAILSWGEPDPKYLGNVYSAYLPQGFRPDEGGNTPVDKKELLLPIVPCWPGHKGTLIGVNMRLQGNVPDQRKAIVAALEGGNLADIVATSNLLDSYLLIGDEEQTDNYAKEIEQALAVHCDTSGFFFREALAIALLKKCDSLVELKILKEDSHSLDIKKDLLELPLYILKALAIYYGIHPSITNSIKRAEALSKEGYINGSLAKALILFLQFVQALRLMSHLHYRTENDTLYFDKDVAPSGALVLNDEQKETVLVFNQCLLVPLFQAARTFLFQAETAFVSNFPFYKATDFTIIHFVMHSLQSFSKLSAESLTAFLQAKANAVANLPLLDEKSQTIFMPGDVKDLWPKSMAFVCLLNILEKSVCLLQKKSQIISIREAFYNPLYYLALGLKLCETIVPESPAEIMQTLVMDDWTGKAFFGLWCVAWEYISCLKEKKISLAEDNDSVFVLETIETALIRPLILRLRELQLTALQDTGRLYRKLLYSILKDYFEYQVSPLSADKELIIELVDFKLKILTRFLEYSLTQHWQHVFTKTQIDVAAMCQQHQCMNKSSLQQSPLQPQIIRALRAYTSYIIDPLHQALLCSSWQQFDNDPLLILCQTLAQNYKDFTLPRATYWCWQNEALNSLLQISYGLSGLGKILPLNDTPFDIPFAAPFDKLALIANSAIFIHADQHQHRAFYQSLPRALRLPWFVLLVKAIQNLIPIPPKEEVSDSLNDISFYQTILNLLAYAVDSTGWRLIQDLQQAVWCRQMLSLVNEIYDDQEVPPEKIKVVMQNLKAPWEVEPKSYLLKSRVQQQLFQEKRFKLRSSEQKGNHTVLRIQSEELTFFCKLCPEQPGMEALIERLAWSVSPFGTPSSILAKFQHGSLTTAVLISAGIAGEDLEWALLHKPERVKYIDMQSFTETLLRVLLINPEDDKADDYFLLETAKTYRLVRIDNERAYYQPDMATESKWIRTKRQLQVKSILYCLDQMQLQLELNSPALQDFCAIDPLSFLKDWVDYYIYLHSHYQRLFNETDVKRHFTLRDSDLQQHFAKDKIKESICLLTAGLAPELLKEQLNRWSSLQTVIRLARQQPHGSLDGVSLLESVQPQLASYYRNIFKDYPITKKANDDPLKRFDRVTYGLYKVRKGGESVYRETSTSGNKAISRSLQLKKQITLDDVLAITRDELYSPSQIRAALDKLTMQRVEDILDDLRQQRAEGVFKLSPVRQQQQIVAALIQEAQNGELTLEQQRYVLQVMTGLSWHDLRLQAFEGVLTDMLISPLLNAAGHHLRILHLSGKAITADLLVLLAKACPQLHVLRLQGMSVAIVGEKNKGFLGSRYTGLAFSHLQALTIQDCGNLKKVHLDVPRLAQIKIRTCFLLQLIDLKDTVLNNLIKASIQKCNQLTTLTLLAPWLQVVKITYNPKLQQLILDSRKLRELQLQGCPLPSHAIKNILSMQQPHYLQKVMLPDSVELHTIIVELAMQFQQKARDDHWLVSCLLALTDIRLRPIIQNILLERIKALDQKKVITEIDYLIQQQPKTAGFFYYRGWLYLQSEDYQQLIADWATYIFLQRKKGEPAILMVSPALQKKLFEMVYASRESTTFSLQASQAMSVLVAAKVSFSRKDLKAIRVLGAILDNGFFDGADFSNSDLSSTSLCNVYLSYANLSRCNLSNVDFQKPLIAKEIPKVHAICFSPDGQYLAAASDQHVLQLDIKKLMQSELLEPDILTLHQDKVMSIAFSPDNNYFATGGQDNTIKVWDKHASKINFAADSYSHAVTSIAFSPKNAKDHPLLLATSSGKTVPLVDVSSGKLFGMVEECHHLVRDIAFNPCPNEQDLYWLAIASGKNILLFDVVKTKLVHTLSLHRDDVNCIAFSPDGRYLVSGSKDKTLRLWDLQHLKMEPDIIAQDGEVMCVAFNPQETKDGYQLVSGNKNHIVRLWNISNRKLVTEIEGHTSAVLSVTFNDDGQLLASAGDDGVRLWQKDGNGYRLFWTSNHFLTALNANLTGASLSLSNFQLLKEHGAIGDRESVNICAPALSSYKYRLFTSTQCTPKLKFKDIAAFNAWVSRGYLEEDGILVERKNKLTLQLCLQEKTLKKETKKEVLKELQKLLHDSIGDNNLVESVCFFKENNVLLTLRFAKKRVADAVYSLLEEHGFFMQKPRCDSSLS